MDDFKLNVEVNHATLALHSFQHELQIAANAGMLGSIDANRGVISLDIPADELKRRMSEWKPVAPRYKTGVIAKYCALVSSASEGAVTRVSQAAP